MILIILMVKFLLQSQFYYSLPILKNLIVLLFYLKYFIGVNIIL